MSHVVSACRTQPLSAVCLFSLNNEPAATLGSHHTQVQVDDKAQAAATRWTFLLALAPQHFFLMLQEL